MIRLPSGRRRRQAAAALLLLGGQAAAVESPTELADAGPWRLDAPAASVLDGVVSTNQGFVLQGRNRLLMGNAMRWNQATSDIYATGEILLTSPGLRLEAEELGANSELETGRFSNATLTLVAGNRRLRLTVGEGTFTPDRFELHDVYLDSGYGGLAAIRAERMVIARYREPREWRDGAARNLKYIIAYGVRMYIADTFVMGSPYLIRDFRQDYPWTRYEFGLSSRQGAWIRGWIGGDIPAGDYRVKLRGHYANYARAGEIFGGRVMATHDRFGRTEVSAHLMPSEEVRRSNDGGVLVERRASTVDAEHQVAIPGGGIYARYVRLPEPDPGQPMDERFRNDYLEDDLDHRPLARRGVAAAFSLAPFSIAIDSDHSASDDLEEFDRELGVQIRIPGFLTIGSVHAQGGAMLEKLRSDAQDTNVDRFSWDTQLRSEWWGDVGIGTLWELGWEGLGYYNPTQADADLEDISAGVPVARFEARTNWQATFENGITHSMIWGLGYEWRGTRRGTGVFPDLGFGDSLADLDSDRRSLTLDLDTTVSGPFASFSASIETRWALRDQDRFYTDDNGDRQRGQNRLQSVEVSASGSPFPTLVLDADIAWDGLRDRYETADAGAAWIVHPRLTLRGGANWIEADSIDDDPDGTWTGDIGGSIYANRYRLDVDVELLEAFGRPTKLAIGLQRQMVDGGIGLVYEVTRDTDTNEIEHNVSFAFTVGGLPTSGAGLP